MIHCLTLSWNGLDKLKKLQRGLFGNMGSSFELLNIFDPILDQKWIWHIRDHGSKDGTIEELKSWPRTKVYDIGHNRDNFAQGMNFLFEQANPADSDFVLLLNNDIVFDEVECISNMLTCMKTGVGIVGARLLYTNTTKLQHAGTIFSNRYGRLPYHYRPAEETDIQAEKNRYFQAVTAACCLVRASSFKRVGGFDEAYRWAFEDVDLNLKIGQQEKIIYCGQTKIYHEESASLKKNPVNKMFMEHNVKTFKSKWWKDGKPLYQIDHDLYLNNPDYNVIKA